MKFPYGLCDFYRLITEGSWYADRTNYIPIIEEQGMQLLFPRPPRASNPVRRPRQTYRQTLAATYGEHLRLRTYAVVAIGFERLVWEEIFDQDDAGESLS